MLFKVVSERGCYMPRRPSEITFLELSDDRALSKAFAIRAPICELIKKDEVVEVAADFVPGPHLEPMDPEAEAAMRQYWRAYPGASLDPTRSLPLTGGFDDLIQGQLNRILAEAGGPQRPTDELAGLRQQMAEMAEAIAKLTAAPKPVAASGGTRR
jgi:hypothetical protein